MSAPTGTDDQVLVRRHHQLLPSPVPLRFLDEDGNEVDEHGGYDAPDPAVALDTWRQMVIGRRLDAQATALARQGRLAVYPSSEGQEACQVGTVLALRRTDWVFPTYRDTVAVLTRGVAPAEALGLLRGTRHCGYDPTAHAVAPQTTPLATHAVHAVGYAYGCARLGDDTVALALVGDGATSEGDFHEALNLAGVLGAPVIFVVQNNRYAISVPLARQTGAPLLADRGIGYGIPGEQVDGNDALAVLAVVGAAAARAREGGGPSLIEAHTYRLAAHTNADDASRYQDEAEVATWRRRDPLPRLEAWLRSGGLLDDALAASIREDAERAAAELRSALAVPEELDPRTLVDHVYARPTPGLAEQRARLGAEAVSAVGA